MATLLGVLVVAVLVGFVAGFTWLQYRQSGGRTLGPLWTAFSFTAASGLFLVAGVLGYNLQGGVPFSRASSWTGHVLWWEIGGAGFLALVALPLWRVGLRRLKSQ